MKLKQTLSVAVLAVAAATSCNKPDAHYSESGFDYGKTDFPYVYATIAPTKASINCRAILSGDREAIP